MKKIWRKIEAVILVACSKMRLSEKKTDTVIEFFRFGIVGISNTILFYLIYAAVVLILERINLFTSFDYIIGNIAAWLLSVLWSFFLNRAFVFNAEKNTESLLYTLFKCYASYALTGLVLNNVLSLIWINGFHLNKMVAPIINLLFSVPINYLLNKYWTFRKKL